MNCQNTYITSFLQGKEKIKSMRELLMLADAEFAWWIDRIRGKGKMSGRRRRICWDAPRLQDGWRINRDWTQWSDEYMKCPNNPSLSHEFHYVLSNPVKECKKKILSQDQQHYLWNKILEYKWLNFIFQHNCWIYDQRVRIQSLKKNILTLDGALRFCMLTYITWFHF